MNAKSWKLIRSSAACLPLALAATHISAHAQQPASSTHDDQHPGMWNFSHEHVLGTSLDIKISASNAFEAQRAEAAALAEFDRQDHILSAWRSDSEFSRWEKTRFEPMRISPELMEVLSSFDHWREATGGALDASAEAAVQLWRQTLRDGRTPTNAEITQTREAIAQQHWTLDATNGTATRLTDTPLALASFAKSYITEHAAQAAMRSGARGVMLNVGGDVIVRGSLQQTVEIADPQQAADNAPEIDAVRVTDRVVATSGSYKRSIQASLSSTVTSGPQVSHLVDPRTALPVTGLISSTVIARNAETAGALATAFAVMPVAESVRLAAAMPGVDYLIVDASGHETRSPGWGNYQAPGIRPVVYTPAAKTPASYAADGLWNANFELSIALELPRIDDARYRRPYIAVWIEDSDHFPVRTLALWTQNPRWLPELKSWYRDDQIRNLAEGTDVSKTVSSATRPPGHYILKWDGKDNDGKPVKAGKYTVVVEASREHGTYQVERKEVDFNGQPQQATLMPGKELGAVTLDYRKR